ncbi:MAG: acylneuraminate cytidylyltransferase [Ignavibacteria bacterium RBG_13_36_8]|nr:MAG: acylneuraminate cytidylyltransferase [Ignavibacteria bacterium RBG_13_36_8]
MKELNIITIIQARTESTRLPNKVLLPILDSPLLSKMIERVNHSKLKGTIVVATSTNSEDDKIEDLCLKQRINYFRGHTTDLLDRHYKAAKKHKAHTVVKIPSDCPLIDPIIIDKVIQYYLDNLGKFDYVSNLHPASYPDGNDVEVISFKVLETAWKEADKDFEREHTTPFIWERPDRFRIGNVEWESGLDYSTTHRWTIDYEEDYQFIKRVFEEFYPKNKNFKLNDIINLLHEKPEIYHINSKYAGKYWYENHLNELNHIIEYKRKILDKK